MPAAAEFLDACHARGIRFVSGTPCSYLKPLINAALGDERFLFRDAVNEGDAVALAAGAVLGGSAAMVMFQNSGLGNAVNALTSLCAPFRVPVLLVITHRGEPGGEPDEPQHEQLGRITPALLDALEISWARLPGAMVEVNGVLDRAFAVLRERERPFALLLSKDAIAPHALRRCPAPVAIGARELPFREELRAADDARPSRTEALAAIRAARGPREVIVATTGYTARELYALGDDPWNLYVVGSMGSASAFGLGLALTACRPVTVVDGDGAVLMRMGNLATVGAYAPPDFVHVILDNEAHESTGGQGTVSRGVAFAAIAQACGYRRVVSADSLDVLGAALAARGDGPLCVHLRIRLGTPAKLPRPGVTPAEVFRRLQAWMQSS